jgi:histidinol-phosphate aminotransferase
MDPLRHVKLSVRGLVGYSPPLPKAPVKLNQNENAWDLPEAAKRRVLEKALARPWSRYPEPDPTDLLEALSRHARWRQDGILVGNGSNEAIEALLRVTVGPGTKVLVPEPSFTLYAVLTRVLGGEMVRVPMSARVAPSGAGDEGSARAQAAFAYDVDAILAARRASGASLTIVCSPNNPTGTSLDLDDLERLCRDGDGLVAIDEAYHEFSARTAVPLLERHPNLIVLRTFSKALALAGLRVGYLLASPELVREINKARLPYNLDFFSATAALAALEEKDALAATVHRLVAERERLFARLADVPGVRAWSSDANFFLIECLSADPKALLDAMLRRGVVVRDVTSYPRLERCLRVTVGTPEENDAFLHALGTALTEAGMDPTTGRA